MRTGEKDGVQGGWRGKCRAGQSFKKKIQVRKTRAATRSHRAGGPRAASGSPRGQDVRRGGVDKMQASRARREEASAALITYFPPPAQVRSFIRAFCGAPEHPQK